VVLHEEKDSQSVKSTDTKIGIFYKLPLGFLTHRSTSLVDEAFLLGSKCLQRFGQEMSNSSGGFNR